VLERSRARALLETLADGHVDLRRGADPQLVARERALQKTLADQSNRRVRLLEHSGHGAELAALDRQLDGVRDQIRRGAAEDSRRAARLRGGDRAAAARRGRDPGAARRRHRAARICARRRAQLCVGGRRALRRRPRARRARGDRGRDAAAARAPHRARRGRAGEVSAAAAALGRLVLAPVAAQIAGKRLLVVSDGALQYIPFAVLAGPDGKLLIDDHEIVHLPSAAVLAALRREGRGRKRAPKAVAVLADPVFDGNDGRVKAKGEPDAAPLLASASPAESSDRLTRSLEDVSASGARGTLLRRLRFTRREAEAIMAVTPNHEGMKALDFDATRARVLSGELADYRIVHFATHGLLDSRRPELSGW